LYSLRAPRQGMCDAGEAQAAALLAHWRGRRHFRALGGGWYARAPSLPPNRMPPTRACRPLPTVPCFVSRFPRHDLEMRDAISRCESSVPPCLRSAFLTPPVPHPLLAPALVRACAAAASLHSHQYSDGCDMSFGVDETDEGRPATMTKLPAQKPQPLQLAPVAAPRWVGGVGARPTLEPHLMVPPGGGNSAVMMASSGSEGGYAAAGYFHPPHGYVLGPMTVANSPGHLPPSHALGTHGSHFSSVPPPHAMIPTLARGMGGAMPQSLAALGSYQPPHPNDVHASSSSHARSRTTSNATSHTTPNASSHAMSPEYREAFTGGNLDILSAVALSDPLRGLPTVA